MTCRTCYLATLTPDERDRAVREPITGTIYLCPEHQAEYDDMTAGIDWTIFVTRKADS